MINMEEAIEKVEEKVEFDPKMLEFCKNMEYFGIVFEKT